MAPKRKGKASAATKNTAGAATRKRKADDQGDDGDTSVPEKKAKLYKMLQGLADDKRNLPIAKGKRSVEGARQQPPTGQPLPQSTTIVDRNEEREHDAVPEPEAQVRPSGGRSHNPTGSVSEDELQPPLNNDDDNEIVQDRPRSQGKGKGRQRDQTPEFQSPPEDGLPFRSSLGSGRIAMNSTSQGLHPWKMPMQARDQPLPLIHELVAKVKKRGTWARQRKLPASVLHIAAWKGFWYRLGSVQVSDITWNTFRLLYMRSKGFADSDHFSDLPSWPDDRDADTHLPEVQRAVENAGLAFYEPQWQESVEEALNDFGQAAVDVLKQRLQGVADAVATGTSLARAPDVSDEFHAEWAGRLDRFRRLTTTDRTRRRFEAAYRRALDIRTTRNLRLRPMKNMDGPAYRSMALYCDRLHDYLMNALLGDVRQRDWPPAPWDDAMSARFARMAIRIMQGFPPYGAGVRSPLAASFTDNARAIGFDHERSRQEAGRWQQMGPLGNGAFGHVGVWALYDKCGRVVNRLALKDTYFARMRNMSEAVDWWNEGNFMLNQSQDSENIVQCRAYSIYDEKRMYRLYLEYCPHADLETTIHAFLKFAAIDREPDDPRVQIPNRALGCIFQALAAALCLMDRGFIPGAPPGQLTALPGFQQMLHRDLKPANVFLGLPKDNLIKDIET
ncbi:hypothetical protein AC579_7832 [Pseudocercospora musae]|uniref:non-specific serine/threonine protein kinase n=1 Tax=Pseudocercospora musae TaxID=113226 RepID=A0A139H9V5_9PEZI|nr:hypothetical protein AC579_7832 [Pseudocercospora musae]